MDDLNDEKRKACSLAKALLKDNVDYLDHVIHLWKIGNSIYGEAWNTEFHVFGVIESDTDHLPTKRVREHCSENMLSNTDGEISEAIDFYKKDVGKACNDILLKYGNV